MFKRFVIIFMLYSPYLNLCVRADSDSLKLSNKIAAIEKYMSVNTDSSLIKINELIKEARKKKQTKDVWELMLAKGKIFNRMGIKDSSLTVLNKLKEDVVFSKDSLFLIKTHTKLAETFAIFYDFEKATTHLYKAESLLKDTTHLNLRFNILHLKASIHRRLKNYNKAKETCLSVFEHYSNQLTDNQKFTILNTLGAIEANQKNYTDAEKYFNQAYNITSSHGEKKDVAQMAKNLGALYFRQKKYKLSEKFIFEALEKYSQIRNKTEIESCYRILGVIQQDLKNYEQAIIFHKKALEIAKEIDNPKSILGNYKNLYLTYGYQADQNEQRELRKKELEYFKKWAYLKDSLYEADMAEKILTLEKEFETEKKNNQINLLEKDNELKESTIKTQRAQRKSLLLIIGLVIIGMGIFVYWYIYYKRVNKVLQKQSKRILEQNEEISTNNGKLQKAINTRNKLFSIIAHDLRSPLTSMANFSKLINFYLKDNKLDAVNRMGVEMQKKNSYVLELTDNLLSWAKSQSDELTPQLEKTCLCEVIEECIEIYSTIANEKNIAIHFSECGDCHVWSDRNMLKTIIRNLINNAIKFTNPEGSIEISYFPKEDFIELSVKDNGIGMNKIEAQNLFSGSKATIKAGTLNEKSTGLGLSICKEFTLALNGQIRAESKEDIGTTIFLNLPAYNNQDNLINTGSSEVEFQNSLN